MDHCVHMSINGLSGLDSILKRPQSHSWIIVGCGRYTTNTHTQSYKKYIFLINAEWKCCHCSAGQSISLNFSCLIIMTVASLTWTCTHYHPNDRLWIIYDVPVTLTCVHIWFELDPLRHCDRLHICTWEEKKLKIWIEWEHYSRFSLFTEVNASS